ncbi:MAG TPA: ATP-binding protein [Streptosporangiaceae bacterium]|jgi:two-component sensor histidine kinase
MCAGALAECKRPAAGLELRLAPVPPAAAEAREFVRDRLPVLGLFHLAENATLVAAELVTNSLKYAPEGPIWLSLHLAGVGLLMEVQDCSARLPVFREPDYVAESGRGLHLVAALCESLGWIALDGGKVIWALLEKE